ncbi:MAG TPA: alpha/beta hydrolase [Burkholderiaceae bacterium]|nr:alpha/beta hydrolase [Burkholderiaceae bacterium]
MQATATMERGSDVFQSPFITADGQHLALLDWALPARMVPRAQVLIVHGLGEHAWRYDALAYQLNSAGFAVRAYDQRGHGDSAGKRGCLPQHDTLLQDLGELVEDTRTNLCARFNTPLVLLGHSMGGLVAALWLAHWQDREPFNRMPVDGLVLSSPAFDVGLGPWQRAMLATLPDWLPNLVVSNGLNPRALSHDPEVVSTYLADPLVHDRFSPRLGKFIADGGPEVLAHASRWRVPTLLMYAGMDALVNPLGSRRFAQQAPAGVVQAHCFEDFFHEIFNETHRVEAVEMLLHWLERRY